MKKNKNETENKNIKKEAVTETVGKKNIPTEDSRNGNDEKELIFKKSLYGYNPEEVDAFVEELNRTHEASLKLHESKLSSMKEELALSNRERDYYINKLKEQKSESGSENKADNGKSAEAEILVLQLKKEVELLKSENEKLKNSQPEQQDVPSDIYEQKISELEARNKELEKALVAQKDENANISQQLKKYENLHDEHKAIMLQLENSKVLVASKEKEADMKDEEIREKNNRINLLVSEKEELEIKLSEIEVQNSVLSERAEENEAEILSLIEKNKALVFENAEKLNAIESEYAQKKLSVQKELKLYGYYLDRAELTVNELTKQIAQIRKSMEESEI